MVYVLNKDGIPLMPTKRHGKVRRMLKNGQAKVVKRCPSTIQLLYDTTNYTQPINLGIDAGSKHIGVCAATEKEELYSAGIELRKDVALISRKLRILRYKEKNISKEELLS